MYGRTSALASYGRVANAETNPLQQIVMLYDGAIKFLRLTAADIEEGNLPAKAEHSTRALDIVGYLQSILDFERGGDVAATLDDLYTSITLKIIRASAALDAAEMRHAADLLAPVRDSWATIAADAKTAAGLQGRATTATSAAPTQVVSAAV
ncbi:MAG: flagellar export chaperone FliS [Pyrinomonadaceae bacterium]